MLFVPVTTLTTWNDACEQSARTIVTGELPELFTQEFALGGFGAAVVPMSFAVSQRLTPVRTTATKMSASHTTSFGRFFGSCPGP